MTRTGTIKSQDGTTIVASRVRIYLTRLGDGAYRGRVNSTQLAIPAGVYELTLDNGSKGPVTLTVTDPNTAGDHYADFADFKPAG